AATVAAEGLVAGEGAVADGDHGSVGHGAGAIDPTPLADAALAAGRPIAREGAVADEQGGVEIIDGAAGGGAARDAGEGAVAADGLVVGKRAVADRQRSAIDVRDAAATGRRDGAETAPAHGQVAGERAVRDREGRAGDVGDAAAARVGASGGADLVV